jgi:Ran-binding protein 9/10
MHLSSKAHNVSPAPLPPPPSWTPAPEVPHQQAPFNNASREEWKEAKKYCSTLPPEPAMVLSLAALDKINTEGCGAWSLEISRGSRFKGRIVHAPQDGHALVRVVTHPGCKDTSLLSNLPVMAGLYGTQGNMGIYYETKIQRMNGIIAVGEYYSFADCLEV